MTTTRPPAPAREKVSVSWEEAMEAWRNGTFGDFHLIRRLAVSAIERDLAEIGAECGISSSDVNHTVYGAIAWGIRFDQTAAQVQEFLRAR